MIHAKTYATLQVVHGDDYDPYAEPTGQALSLDTLDRRLAPSEQVAPIVLPRTVAPHHPGLRIFHDIRNERFPMSAVRPVAATFTPRTIHHRQYRFYNQGETPACTGYSSVTLLAAAHPFNEPPLDGLSWYERNVAFDRAAGRFYDGGATVIAAMEVGRQLGLFSEYRWLYTLLELQQAILHVPIILGTNWYPSMWERSGEGIVTSPGKSEQAAGGHQFVLNGYDARRGLWRNPETWGDGDYLIPDDLIHRLLREDGEATQPTEIKLTKGYHVPDA